MLLNFTGKNVFITGGSRGIGRACAILFSKLKANVAITYKSNKVEAEKTLSMLDSDLMNVMYALDINDAASVENVFSNAVDQFKGIDVVVNNAGVFLEHKIDSISYEKWQQIWQETISTNLMGVSNLCYVAGQHMIKNGGGKIVNIGSRGAFRGEPDHPAYGASKAGLHAMSQSLAIALAPYNISIGVVAPGFVETDMTSAYLKSEKGNAVKKQSPLNRVATADEVANIVSVFAADGFEFMTGGIVDLNGASYLRT
ncbi:MAG: SDR family NAD(P)-dependent oxidoreductase [Chitinophagaceae bacterium]